MKILTRLPFLIAVCTIFFQGCSGTTVPPSEPVSTKVTYNVGTNTTYLQNRLDTAGGTHGGNDVIDPTSNDTITSTVIVAPYTINRDTIFGANHSITSISVDTTVLGKPFGIVTAFSNKHSKKSVATYDTTYIAQDSGNYWHYNYGLEGVNSNPLVLGYNGGQPLQVGWVLQAKLSATTGTAWTTGPTPVKVGSFNAEVKVSSIAQKDTTILVGAEPLQSKHVMHSVELSFANAIISTTTIDTYINTSNGTTLNMVHSSSATLPGGQTIAVPGTYTAMVKHS